MVSFTPWSDVGAEETSLSSGVDAEGLSAIEVKVRGIVQGVGFRPFVHRLALRFGLVGWVRNESGAVRIRVQGKNSDLAAFLEALRVEAPPLARLDEVETTAADRAGFSSFQVYGSVSDAQGRVLVSPDTAICEACLDELFDPSNRRYHHPFITCTDCGPRFTLIRDMPYDRERTSMADFEPCSQCLEEYNSPQDRRFHSETNACPNCGPRIWLELVEETHQRKSKTGCEESDAVIDRAAELLHRGMILAIRGIGGFHLAVDATREEAVRRLRERKGRESKPLAVMVADLAAARRIAVIDREAEKLLLCKERPIVLVPKRPTAPLAPSVSPGLGWVGLMLPYAPLHHLLLRAVGLPLVMTSGNRSEEPIAVGNGEARQRLSPVADAFLLHNREIVSRCDDSVVRWCGGGLGILVRRSRGYAPLPLALPSPSPVPLLAVGAHLKNTLALVQGREVFLSQHVGDLENLETLEHFESSLRRLRALFRVEPRRIAADLHPDYLSTRLAEELSRHWDLAPPLRIQHHHAHVAAVAAEHGIEEPVVGIAYDGTGYGEDGAIWGAEILVGDLQTCRRLGHLRYAPLPGGEAAVRQPWRSALGYASLDESLVEKWRTVWDGLREKEFALVRAQVRAGIHAPPMSSMGRLFDAAAAILGVRSRADYEGQAAMELESLAGQGGKAGWPTREPLPFPVHREGDGRWLMDPLPLLDALFDRRKKGEDVGELALRFHEAVARTTVEVAEAVCEEEKISVVAIGGGTFQNALLIRRVFRLLKRRGLRVLLPRLVPPNDGGISFGQAAVAAARLRSETR